MRYMSTYYMYISFSVIIARLATSRFQGAKELLETEFPEEECRNEDLPPTFLCHAAGMLILIATSHLNYEL